ncbi:MAG: tRNA(fMet)-specific endonuclease VapC [Chloroflexi bacterium ADurb.Bin325]|nr:MAG: tRNA(fMet)-specific endonuclease VapC [Chloroflexi bacterium ADurb.Bin325]
MDVVIDTSVIIAVIAGEPERDGLVELTQGVNLLAPPSVHWEIGNAFSAMLRRRRTTLDRVMEALELYSRVPIRFAQIDLEEAMELADHLGIYAYDAYLLACAQRYRAPLLTLDATLRGQAERLDIKVWEQ